MNYTDKSGGKAPLGSGTFDSVMDDAWGRLWDKKVELSIRRIRKLEEYLTAMEAELDDFISQGGAGDEI